MRSRIPSITAALVLVVALVLPTTMVAFGQSVDQAGRELDRAQEKANATRGLVDDAVANRDQIELRIAESISRVNDLSAALSLVGSKVDRLGDQLGFADIELADVKEQIEVQAVDAYMSLIASPSLSLVSSPSVETALVVSSVVGDVISGGRLRVNELFVRKRGLEELHLLYVSEQDEFAVAKAEMDVEIERLAALYEEADQAVADAMRAATAADQAYRAAMTTFDLTRQREEERRRQEERNSTTTTVVTSATTTTTANNPTTTSPGNPTTTTTPSPTTTTPTVFPPHIEQWRSLVATHFPANRVDEALKIVRCESNGDPNAYNPYSGASGLFQFIPSTWATAAAQAGYSGASPFEPVANTATAAWLANRYESMGLYYWMAWSCKRVLN